MGDLDMMYRIMVLRYGYVEVESDNAEEALQMAGNMDVEDVEWNDFFDDEKIVEEWNEDEE